jgi:hypothetical protein
MWYRKKCHDNKIRRNLVKNGEITTEQTACRVGFYCLPDKISQLLLQVCKKKNNIVPTLALGFLSYLLDLSGI